MITVVWLVLLGSFAAWMLGRIGIHVAAWKVIGWSVAGAVAVAVAPAVMKLLSAPPAALAFGAGTVLVFGIASWTRFAGQRRSIDPYLQQPETSRKKRVNGGDQ